MGLFLEERQVWINTGPVSMLDLWLYEGIKVTCKNISLLL